MELGSAVQSGPPVHGYVHEPYPLCTELHALQIFTIVLCVNGYKLYINRTLYK